MTLGDKRSILFVSNYSSTGIGDFGLELYRQLRTAEVPVVIAQTPTGWSGFTSQIRRIIEHPGPVLANIGLTAWGLSGIRNFLGFVTLGVRGSLGRSTTVLLHNVIEIIVEADSGYQFHRGTRFVAHLAVQFLRSCFVVVFSSKIAEELREKYDFSKVEVMELPCSPIPARTDPPSGCAIVWLGYLAPYKGLDLLVEIAQRMGSTARFLVIGGPHRLLADDPDYKTQITRIRALGEAAGVTFTGYLQDGDLSKLLRGAFVGVLTHRSSSGASAAFASLASAALPVVTTDIAEFQDLERAGAGLLTSVASADGFARVLETLRSNPALWRSLSAKQAEYASRHSWVNLVERVTASVVFRRDKGSASKNRPTHPE